jgi:transposase
MSSEATRSGEISVGEQVLYMALELSQTRWGVLFASACGKRRERSVAACALGKLLEEMAAAKRRLGLSPDAPVVSCYEAGRDGFWLDRALRANGIDNLVVDSSSIEVARRARRAKTDRVDLVKLMGLLLRWVAGERKVWSVVRVPSAEAEDIRQLSRSIERLKGEHGRHVTRIKALLATQGLKLARIGGPDWGKRVGDLRRWDGSVLGKCLQRDLVLEGERLAVVAEQLAALKAERDRLVAEGCEAAAVKARELAKLGAIAAESSFVFATELFGWRTFANRRELAGSVGLTGTPYNSGQSAREQGISKAGNKRMRTMLVEIAWCWLRYQPHSALSVWWQRRFGSSGGRGRKIAIVALARKLLVALWRYLEHGIVPEGATLKTRPA